VYTSFKGCDYLPPSERDSFVIILFLFVFFLGLLYIFPLGEACKKTFMTRVYIFQRLFAIIDRQANGIVTWAEMVAGLELIMHGSTEDKFKRKFPLTPSFFLFLFKVAWR
jgi:hypothetical protein